MGNDACITFHIKGGDLQMIYNELEREFEALELEPDEFWISEPYVWGFFESLSYSEDEVTEIFADFVKTMDVTVEITYQPEDSEEWMIYVGADAEDMYCAEEIEKLYAAFVYLDRHRAAASRQLAQRKWLFPDLQAKLTEWLDAEG